MKQSKKYSHFVLSFMVPFLAIYGVVMFLPILPILQEHFGVTVSEISWLPNIGYLNMILFSPIIGMLAKRYQVKQVLLTMIGIWGLGIGVEWIAFSASHFQLFIAGRFIEAIGEAAFFPLLLIINKAVLKEENDGKVGASLIEIGSSVGGLIAGVFAGLMSHRIQNFLIIPMILALLTFIFVSSRIGFIKIAEEVSTKQKREVENKLLFKSLLVLIFLVQGVFVSAQVYLSYYLQIFDKAETTGVIISLQQLGITFGALTPILLLRKYSMVQIRNVMIPFFLISLILLSMNISYGISVMLLLVICFMTGVAFSMLNISTGKVVKNNIMQKMSLYTSLRFLGGFSFSYILAYVIGKYSAQGVGYGEIFSRIYLSVAVVSTIVIAIVVMIQSKGNNIKNGEMLNGNVY